MRGLWVEVEDFSSLVGGRMPTDAEKVTFPTFAALPYKLWSEPENRIYPILVRCWLHLVAAGLTNRIYSVLV